MTLRRRAWLLAALASPGARAMPVQPRTLVFPRDHGAHLEQSIEWWYVTGWLQSVNAARSEPAWGFQLTFFRSRTGLALDGNRSRFAARHLLFAHAALTDLGARHLRHAERMARWSGDAMASGASAALDDTQVRLGGWSLLREPHGLYRCEWADATAAFGLRLALEPTQPLLLQGDSGFSQKGPAPHHASHYLSHPQLSVDGDLSRDHEAVLKVRGRAWLDHEWSDSLLPEGAVGWDWIGINLDDGGALTAFRLRDGAGQAVWAGGSHRSRDGVLRAFEAHQLRFEPLAWWTSSATRARYPVRWRIVTPAGIFEVRALLDAQELDARSSTGSVYWEGLSALHRADDGARVGWGYLEMTGYAAPLRLA